MSLNKWSFSFPARNWMSPFKPFDPFFLYFLSRPFYFPLPDFKIEAKKKINERELDLTEPHRRLARFTPSLEPHLAPLNTLVFPHQRLNFALCWSQRLLSLFDSAGCCSPSTISCDFKGQLEEQKKVLPQPVAIQSWVQVDACQFGDGDKSVGSMSMLVWTWATERGLNL
jgi:hypothetical protein